MSLPLPLPDDASGSSWTPEAQAVGAVLYRAHDAARHLEHLLELEAADPRVAELQQQAKRVRKSIAALLVEVAAEATPEPVMEA